MNAVWIKNLLLNNPRLSCFVNGLLHLVQHFSAQVHLHIANPCQVQISKDIGSSGQKFQKGIPCLLSFDGNTGWLSRLVIPQWDRAAHGIDVIDYRREESGVVFVPVVFQDPLHRCVDHLIWRKKIFLVFHRFFSWFCHIPLGPPPCLPGWNWLPTRRSLPLPTFSAWTPSRCWCPSIVIHPWFISLRVVPFMPRRSILAIPPSRAVVPPIRHGKPQLLCSKKTVIKIECQMSWCCYCNFTWNHVTHAPLPAKSELYCGTKKHLTVAYAVMIIQQSNSIKHHFLAATWQNNCTLRPSKG